MQSPVGAKRRIERVVAIAALVNLDPNMQPIIQQPNVPPRPQWLKTVNERVAPYVASAWFMAATFLNPALDPWTPAWTRVVLPYVFSATFFSYVTFTVAYWVEYLVRNGWIKWLRKWVGELLETAWRELLRTQRIYWVKFVLGCLLITLAVFLITWLHQHLDIWYFTVSTWDLFWGVLRSLLNVPELARAIQSWTNQRILSWIVGPTSAVLAFALQYLIESPIKGAAIIIVTLAGTIATAFGGLMLKDCWYGNRPNRA